MTDISAQHVLFTKLAQIIELLDVQTKQIGLLNEASKTTLEVLKKHEKALDQLDELHDHLAPRARECRKRHE